MRKAILQNVPWLRQGWTLGITLVLAISSAIVTRCDRGLAQVIGDTTLGAESTQVRQNGSTFQIDQGATRGTNLFHSFSQFSVPTGGTAFFNNDQAIQNIIGRVIGPASNIDGILRANGTANLFLINPNGISFGANARLIVGGSFVASTANALQFSNQGIFSASNPNVPPDTLTINPSAFLFNQLAAQSIINRSVVEDPSVDPGKFVSVGLRAGDGKSLLLVGGDVILQGGFLTAAGGQVELGGVAGSGTVELISNPDGSNLRLGFPTDVARANVFLRDGATVNVAASNNNAGAIFIQAGSIFLEGRSRLSSATFDTLDAGIVSLDATNAVSIKESQIFSSAEQDASGNAGQIRINASSVSLETAALTTENKGSGLAGEITIVARDQVSIMNNSELTSKSNNGIDNQYGFIQIEATQGSVFVEQSRLSATNLGSGKAGDVSISARDTVSLKDLTGNLSQNVPKGVFSQGNSGRIFIGEGGGYSSISPSTVTIVNSRLNTTNTDSGVAGDISISARDQVSIRNGSQIISQGNSGRIIIGAYQDYASVSPKTVTINNSRLSTTNFGDGYAGDIVISASDTVSIRNGSGIFSRGYYGRIFIGESNVYPESVSPKIVRIDRSTVNTDDGNPDDPNSTFKSGKAGDISISSSDSIRLDNGSTIKSNTTGEGGNIYLSSPLILLRGSGKLPQDTLISTNATGANSPGGNITINTTNLVGVPKENSDITANSKDSRGGNVTINASGGIFGLKFRTQLTPRSDITATGRENGSVILNTPVVDPAQGLEELPVTVTDPSNQIVTTCQAAAQGNSFTVTGRGGLAEDPTAIIRGQTVWRDLQDYSQGTGVGQASPQNPQALMGKHSPRLVEANSWVFDEKGNVVLVATQGNGTSAIYKSRQPNCQDLSSLEAPKN